VTGIGPGTPIARIQPIGAITTPFSSCAIQKFCQKLFNIFRVPHSHLLQRTLHRWNLVHRSLQRLYNEWQKLIPHRFHFFIAQEIHGVVQILLELARVIHQGRYGRIC